MNYKYILTAILIVAVFSGTASAWLSGYDHRMAITVNNGGASELNYYQFNFTNDTNILVAAGNMQASGADCRVTDSSDNLIPFWNETPFNAAGTKIWANGTTLAVGDDTFYMYYGNAVAESQYNGSTTFINYCGFENASDGTCVSNHDWWTTGKVGNAFNFSNYTVCNSWVNCGNSTNLNQIGSGDFTIESWVKRDYDFVQDAFFKGDTYGKWTSYTPRSWNHSSSHWNSNGTLWLQFDDGVVGGALANNSINISDNEWHHVAFAFERDGGNWNMTAYTDGVQSSNALSSQGLFNNPSPLVFGKCCWGGDPAQEYDGSAWCHNYEEELDEFRVYNRTLTATEVGWSHARGNAGLKSNVSSTGLIGYWAFDESSGTNVSDSSGHGEHGVIESTEGSGGLCGLCGFDNGTQSTDYAFEGAYSYKPPNAAKGTKNYTWPSRPFITEYELYIPSGQSDDLMDSIIALTNSHDFEYNAGYPNVNNWGNYDGGAVWNDSGVAFTTGAWATMKFILHSSDTYEMYQDATLVTSGNMRAYANGNKHTFQLYDGKNAYIDVLRVRKYTSPEPTATLGAEETSSSGGAYNITLPLGWSIIGWTDSTDRTAHYMGGLIGGNCSYVTERNRTTGQYVNHNMAGPESENNFAIERGWGYFVSTTAETLWERAT
jgi:hypothetical protein